MRRRIPAELNCQIQPVSHPTGLAYPFDVTQRVAVEFGSIILLKILQAASETAHGRAMNLRCMPFVDGKGGSTAYLKTPEAS